MFDDFFMKSFYNLNLIITKREKEREKEYKNRELDGANGEGTKKEASKTLKRNRDTKRRKKGKREQTMSFHHRSHNNR